MGMHRAGSMPENWSRFDWFWNLLDSNSDHGVYALGYFKRTLFKRSS